MALGTGGSRSSVQRAHKFLSGTPVDHVPSTCVAAHEAVHGHPHATNRERHMSLVRGNPARTLARASALRPMIFVVHGPRTRTRSALAIRVLTLLTLTWLPVARRSTAAADGLRVRRHRPGRRARCGGGRGTPHLAHSPAVPVDRPDADAHPAPHADSAAHTGTAASPRRSPRPRRHRRPPRNPTAATRHRPRPRPAPRPAPARATAARPDAGPGAHAEALGQADPERPLSPTPVSYPPYRATPRRRPARSGPSPVSLALLITAPAVLAVAALRPR